MPLLPQKQKGRKDPLIERVLIFVVIGHHTMDIPEISLRFLSFAITTFGFSVRVKSNHVFFIDEVFHG